MNLGMGMNMGMRMGFPNMPNMPNMNMFGLTMPHNIYNNNDTYNISCIILYRTSNKYNNNAKKLYSKIANSSQGFYTSTRNKYCRVE